MVKLVKDSTGTVIAFGSGEGYEPFIAEGNTLVELPNEEAQPLIDEMVARLQPV